MKRLIQEAIGETDWSWPVTFVAEKDLMIRPSDLLPHDEMNFFPFGLRLRNLHPAENDEAKQTRQK